MNIWNNIKSFYNSLVEFFDIKVIYRAKKFNDKNKIFMFKKIYSNIKSRISNINKLYKIFDW